MSSIHRDKLEHLPRERLIRLVIRMMKRSQRTELKMLTKQEVAGRLGMTVSWLDNSQSDLATEIRASGVRYGPSRTSPVRYPLAKLLEIMEALSAD